MRRSRPKLQQALTSVLILGGLYLMLQWWAGSQVYFPLRFPGGNYDLASELRAEDVWLHTSDGLKLHAWWIAGQSASVVTVFFHGNAGNISNRERHIREITGAGSDLLIIDYRGYGKSEGRPSEQGLYADADAAYGCVAEKGKPIVLHGESLGTAVAVDLAARKPAAGLILEAPFTSITDMAGRVLPVLGPLLMRGYDTESKIARIERPLLLIHGDSDTLVPPEFGRRVYAAAPGPKSLWIVRRAGHNDILESAGAEYSARLRQFYGSLIRR